MVDPITTYPDDEIDFIAIAKDVWKGKWIVIGFTVLFTALGVVYALSQPDIYEARVVLAPKDGGDQGSSGLQGLASLAGISIGGSGLHQSVVAQEVLKSRKFLGEFIDRHDYAPQLLAVESWAAEEGEIILNNQLYDSTTGEWLSGRPSAWRLVNVIRAGLSIVQNSKTGMLSISFQHQSPLFVKEVVDSLVKDINEHMRKIDIKEGETSIRYLEEKIQETSISGMQQVFFQLIETETRKLMLANVSPEYVFKTIDPAVIPEVPSLPKRGLIVIVAAMSGTLFGIMLVVVRLQFSNDKNAEQRLLKAN